MRNRAAAVVVLGLAALAFVAIDAFRTPMSGAAGQVANGGTGRGFSWLVFWAVIVALVALGTGARGLGDVMMARRDRNTADPTRPPNGETAAMIDAEVNEGGPPSPVPCDTPSARDAYPKERTSMSEESPMIEACPAPDRVLRLPLNGAVGAATSKTLLKSAGLELIRLVVPAGRVIPPHRAAGEITVQCIEGHVAFEHDGHVVDLRAGDLLHLCPQEIHALKGITDSSVLVTRLRPHADELPEAFPAR